MSQLRPSRENKIRQTGIRAFWNQSKTSLGSSKSSKCFFPCVFKKNDIADLGFCFLSEKKNGSSWIPARIHWIIGGLFHRDLFCRDGERIENIICNFLSETVLSWLQFGNESRKIRLTSLIESKIFGQNDSRCFCTDKGLRPAPGRAPPFFLCRRFILSIGHNNNSYQKWKLSQLRQTIYAFTG